MTEGPQRTLAQNRYYYGVVLVVVADALTKSSGIPVSIKAAHAMCKQEFLSSAIINSATGEIIGRFPPPSTSSLTIDGFCQYLDQIIGWARKSLNVDITPAR